MPPSFNRYLRDNLLLVQHHVNDIESTKSKDVVKSSARDIEEEVDNIRKTLPVKDQISVKSEEFRKESQYLDNHNNSLKVPGQGNNMTQPTREQLVKIANDCESLDRANAIEIGFAKAAQDAGLDEVEYNNLRKVAIDLIKSKQI